jgi:hypothetical protein
LFNAQQIPGDVELG